MTPDQIVAWMQAGQILLGAGVATVSMIKAWIKARHPAASDAELNVLLDDIVASAAAHKVLAEGDADPTTAA